MTIDRVGPLDNISKIRKSNKLPKTGKTNKKDSISFSREAREKAEIFNALEITKKSPDVRLDRIAEVKKKLEDPSYINDKVVELVAEKIMESFNIK